MEYADKWKQQYRDALNDQAMLSSLGGATLIPIGAATIGLAITGAPTQATTIVGLTGATAYGVGAWFENKPRQIAYAEGYRAIGCAQAAFAPLALLDAETTVGGQELTVAAALQGNMSMLSAEVEKCQKGGSQSADVTRIIANAQESLRTGRNLLAEHATAGTRLMLATDDIVGQVDRLIISSQPGLAGVQATLAGIAGFYGQLTSVPASREALRETARAKSQAECQTDTLADLSNHIAGIVNQVGAQRPLDALRECKVLVDTIPETLQLTPQPPFQIKQGTTTAITIMGGKAPYIVEAYPTGHVTFTWPNRQGSTFIMAASATSSGTYSLVVSDSSGKSAVAELTIQTTQ